MINREKLIDPCMFTQVIEIPLVDEWLPNPEDLIFKTTAGSVILDIDDDNFNNENYMNIFDMSIKRAYNGQELREHIVHYINYFSKFYDFNNELVLIYKSMKLSMDRLASYSQDNLIYDINKYILGPSMSVKIYNMNTYNYSLNLQYQNKKNPGLQYQDKHGLILMEISVIMNILIPLLSHFMYVNKIKNSSEFLLTIYNFILEKYMDRSDIFNKLYETAYTNVLKNAEHHHILWNAQDIRAINPTIHALGCVNNILLNIIPKYNYSQNIIHLNFKSIIKNTQYQITDISYEFSFISFSSSKRDEENNSEIDKMDARLRKADEALANLVDVNCKTVLENLNSQWDISEDEIDFYFEQSFDTLNYSLNINTFQRDLVLYPLYKYFGDPISAMKINAREYINLMIILKKYLLSKGLTVLPSIISGKVERIVSRKNVNKKEFVKLDSSPKYEAIKNKYRDESKEKEILSIIATIVSSDFKHVSYEFDELNGKPIQYLSDIIAEEVLLYVSMI